MKELMKQFNAANQTAADAAYADNRMATDRFNISRGDVLANQIIYYKKMYYLGSPVVPDAVYDRLEYKLQSISPNNESLNVGYSDLSSQKNKVSHNPPMLSLPKTYNIQDLLTFISKQDVVCSDKVDGMAVSLKYTAEGFFYRASTRGNGVLGEDISEHMHYVSSIPKSISLNLSDKISYIEFRGELFFPHSKFKNFSDIFDNERNAVAGSLGRKHPKKSKEVLNSLLFYCYDIIMYNYEGEAISKKEINKFLNTGEGFYSKAKAIESLGFFTGIANNSCRLVKPGISAEELKSFLESFYSAKRDYSIDGLVFRYNSDEFWESLGFTSRYPKGSLAFKRDGATAVTTIESIDIQLGRTGRLTFRAKLSPVYLSGAKINYATLHNASFIEQGGYAPGAKVKIKRSGEVIPYIIDLVKPSNSDWKLPSSCSCGSSLVREGSDLLCSLKESCPLANSEFLEYFVKSMGIDGVSEKILQKLKLEGLVLQPPDLFKLTKEDLLKLPNFKNKSAQNVYNAINAKKEVPLHVFLTSLGLKGGGSVRCKEVAETYKALNKVRFLTVEELSSLKGWATTSAYNFINSLNFKSKLIDDLLKEVKVLEPSSENSNENKKLSLQNISFCITGSLQKPRKFYVSEIEKLGGKVVSSVTSNTNYLVANSVSNSSKFLKAKELGIDVISESDLNNKFL